jgi:ubiquinone/menaquinone biosynthesis C-methylase UbiE
LEQINESKKPKKFADVVIRRLEKFLVHHRLLAWMYFVFFRKMTIDEFAMVDLKPGASVVNIGCGSFPHTIITLAQVRGWNITGVDKDKKAIENAQKVVSEHGLSDKIKIIWGEGKDFDVSTFDLIIVSHGIEPKKEVIENLGENMGKNAQIFYRTTWDKLGRVYGVEEAPKNLKIQASYDRIDGIKAYVLVKNENNK